MLRDVNLARHLCLHVHRCSLCFSDGRVQARTVSEIRGGERKRVRDEGKEGGRGRTAEKERIKAQSNVPKKRRVAPPNPNSAHVVISGKSGRKHRTSSVLLKRTPPLLQGAVLSRAALNVCVSSLSAASAPDSGARCPGRVATAPFLLRISQNPTNEGIH